MQQINTQEVVQKFATNCVDWLNKDSRIVEFNYNKRSKLWLSLEAFRQYLDKLLYHIVDDRVGTDSELDLGHYHLTSSSNKNYVVVKCSKRRLPKTPAAYIGWVDWDIHPRALNRDVLYSKFVKVIYTGSGEWDSVSTNLAHRLSLLHASILSQVLVQSLFNLQDGGVDLVNKPLPSQDVKCRIGSYEMLYDHLMQEWRIWKKS
jgi:hypothetical protein